MRNRKLLPLALVLLGLVAAGLLKMATAQAPGSEEPGQRAEGDPRGEAPPFGPGGRPQFGPGGPRGGFGPGQEDRKLVKNFDRDDNGVLNAAERKEARASLKSEGEAGRGGFGRRGGGGPGGRGGNQPTPTPGPRVSPGEVESFPDAPLYDPAVVRTLFLNFENNDWEAEMVDFHNTDVEVPATLTVDGKEYPNVGVHFRGASSFGVPTGAKRSLNVSLDFQDDEQRLYGYKTLNLLNASGDPSLMSTIIYSHIARQHMPAPKANFVKVVINGESWGVYVNVQQFDKVFLEENYESSKGVRWKVHGSPGGDAGLNYVGDNIDEYKRRYEMKTDDGEKAWKDLINLCRTLSETPLDQLEASLEPILDIDGVLWFLAIDNALMNSDGYWIRASDYSIFRDADGKFHLVPHDMNEAFRAEGGPGGMRGRGGRGFGGGRRPDFAGPPPGQRDAGEPAPPEAGRERTAGEAAFAVDPLVGLDDLRKPLRSRLLAVPALRARYLEHVRTIAEKDLDWNKLGPVVEKYRDLIAKDVQADTRKLASYEEFERATSSEAEAESPARGGRPMRSLHAFAVGRREYLLNHPEVKLAAGPQE